MIIWSGFGFLVPFIALLSLFATEAATNAVLADPTYFQSHGWPKLVALLIAGAIVWLVGNALNQRGARVLIDKQTGQEVLLRRRHTLFFIDMRYWAAILAIVGVILLVAR